eukprot:gene944-1196_t
MLKFTKLCIAMLVMVTMASFVVHADLGIDIDAGTSGSVTSSQLQCLAQKNTRIIIQAFSGGYGINKNIGKAVSAAKSAGFETIDLYAFLCNQCSGNSPSSSAIQSLVSYLKSNGVSFGTLWIDVEQCNGCWGSLTQNAQFVVEAVQAAANLGLSVGVYSSLGEWPQTVGSLSSLSSYPLWYAHYDNNPSFSDSQFYQFGGWSSPAMKQYAGDTSECGVSVDLDYFTGSTTSSSSSSSSSSSGQTTSPISGTSGTTSGSSGPSGTSGTTSGSSGPSGSSGTTSGSASASSSGQTSSPLSGTTSGSASASSSGQSSSGQSSSGQSSSGQSSSGQTSGQSASSSGQSSSGSGSGSGSATSGSGSNSSSSTGSGSASSGTGSNTSGTATSSGSGTGSSSSSGSSSGSGSGSGTSTTTK